MNFYRTHFKRIFDILSASAALVGLSPVFILTALAIKLEDGGPVFFRQDRCGKNGQIFRIWKFRSMPVNSENVPSAQAADLKITRVGRFIRRTNIDELPQLFNILIGDMSVVGPRPCLPTQRVLLGFRKKNGAIACKPGLTGLAQIRSYDGMPENEKAEWDGRYSTSISFLGDMKIILGTLRYLMKRPPVY